MEKLDPKRFFIALLGIPEFVKIRVVKRKFAENETVLVGYCYNDLNDCYVIVIDEAIVNDPDPTYWIETLAHELTHVEQYVSKKLVDTLGGLTYWKGEAIDENLLPYDKLPWEAEAFQKQMELTLEYFSYMKRHH